MGILDRRRGLLAKSNPIQPDQDILLDSPPYFDITGAQIITNGITSQGACFVYKSSSSYIYFFAVSSNNSTQYLYEFNLTSGTLTLKETYTSLSHANSMTYNPTENVLYVATQDSSIGIAVISLSDFSVTTTFQTRDANQTACIPYAIAYDRGNDVIYSWFSGTKVFVYSTTGQYIRTITLSESHTHTTEQGMETDGEYLYHVWSAPSNIVEVYKIDGTYVKALSIGFLYETEELIYDWNSGKFYMNAYQSASRQRLYAVLIRSFNGFLDMAYVPPAAWKLKQTGGTISRWASTAGFGFTFKSTAAKSWNLNITGAGSPYGYSNLVGKKCRISFEVQRTAGSSGSVYVQLFSSTTNDKDAATIYNASKSKAIPSVSGVYDQYEYEFVLGTDFFTPSSGSEGNYINYRILLYADSGNNCYVKNFMFAVEV